MPFLTQTYTRDATTCPRPKGSEAATAGRAATASGGRDSMIFPPQFYNFLYTLLLLRCRHEAASGASAAKSYAPSQLLLLWHAGTGNRQKTNNYN